MFVLGKRAYFISDDGQIWGGRYMRLYKPYTDKDGYKTTTIDNQVFKVHRLVALFFLGLPPAGKELVRHLDGDPGNNNVSNLAWGDVNENWQDRVRHGRAANGRQHGRAKLTDADVLKIRSFKPEKGVPFLAALALKYGVSKPLIQKIRSREIWRHL